MVIATYILSNNYRYDKVGKSRTRPSEGLAFANIDKGGLPEVFTPSDIVQKKNDD